MQDGGWIRLPRATVKRTGAHAAVSCLGLAVVVIGGFFFLTSLQLPALVTFVSIVALVALLAAGLSGLWDLLWGAGVVVSVSRQSVHAGESFRVRCSIGHPRRVQSVTVVWQGREEAVLRGYDSTTFAEPFSSLELVGLKDGTRTIEVPGDAMPSFKSKNTAIIWSISVATRTGGGVSRDDFPVLVVPGRL